MTLSFLNQKREDYKTIMKINPNTIDSVQWFQSAIDAINTAILLILNPTKKFSRISAIEPAQKEFIEELELLKKELEEHPNRIKAVDNENARKLTEALREQEWKLKTDKQFVDRLSTIIPTNIEFKNKDIFLNSIVRRIFETQDFDERDRKHGEYERDKYAGNVLAIFDFLESFWCHVMVVKTKIGYENIFNLELHKMPKIYTSSKDPITPTIAFSPDYIKSKKK